ncbi:hypothetical protein AALL81_02950 [Phocaeicola sartorii]
MELGKPKRLLTTIKSGKPTVRKAEWRVGKRLQKKRRLCCNGRDRVCNITHCESKQTSVW